MLAGLDITVYGYRYTAVRSAEVTRPSVFGFDGLTVSAKKITVA
jgi:hypothetical protein